MRHLLIFAALYVLPANAQTREFYAGLNTSNYFFNQEGIQNVSKFERGSQFGFMMSGKSRNLFGKLKRITPKLNVEYNRSFYSFNEVRSDVATSHAIDAHSLRVAVPIQLRLSKNSKRVQFHLSGAPGINFTAFQMENGQSYANAPAKSMDLFINAGGGVLLNTSRSKYEKEGYKFSGITLNANKYFPISLVRSSGFAKSSLDQYQLSVGLQFSYFNKSAGSKMKDWFKRDAK